MPRLERPSDIGANHRLVAVLGASGFGKSSLLHAGMVGADPRPAVIFTPRRVTARGMRGALGRVRGRIRPRVAPEFTGEPASLPLRIRQALAVHPPEHELLR